MLEPGCNCRRQCTTLVISLLSIISTYVMNIKRRICPPGGRGRAGLRHAPTVWCTACISVRKSGTVGAPRREARKHTECTGVMAIIPR